MNKLLGYITKLTLVLAVMMSIFFAVGRGLTFAEDPLQDVCQGKGAQSAACQSKGTINNPLLGPDGVLTKVVQILIIVVGIASVIVIMVGGFKYVISNGDSNNINSAKNTILYALIGLGVSIMAQAIVIFVLNRL